MNARESNNSASSSCSPVYATLIILKFDAKRRSVGRLTQERSLEQSRSSNSSPLIEKAVQIRQRGIHEMMDAAVPDTQEVEVKTYNQVREMAHARAPVASPELASLAVEAMGNVREAAYSICSFHTVDFRERGDK